MKRLSEIHPIIYKARIKQKRIGRRFADAVRGVRFATRIDAGDLPFRCTRHQSLLRRRLGDSDPVLQENKVVNLGIACPNIDGVVIRPGETFSFWKMIGEATAEKGYVEGMQLSQGEVVRGVGGGLCQLANLLYWMSLHTPLEVAERHHHSFDPFPDEHRVLPFGSGAGVFYNYIDLRFFNPTEAAFQIRVSLTDQHLKGSVYSSHEPGCSYHIYERGHRFIEKDGRNYRENEIWRRVTDRRTGDTLADELIVRNHAEVKYQLNFAAAACNL
ncbi:MAG: VanW family protein [Acidobacteria bacterium]|nr:VanW family protein [Acidobacteriota bacterium]MCW5949932.1 VanW family protein [Pyrinomonadaceae bacterium]